MNIHDAGNSLRDFWREFRKVKYGLVGLGLLIVFIVFIVFGSVLSPFPEAGSHWRDITYWEDNPKNAAPVWVNLFSSKDRTPQTTLETSLVRVSEDNPRNFEARFDYNNSYYYPPNDMSLRASGKGTVSLSLRWLRPDGQSIVLLNKAYTFGSTGQLRLSLSKLTTGPTVAFAKHFEPYPNSIALELSRPMELLFAEGSSDMFEQPVSLQGDYEILVTAALIGQDSRLDDLNLLVAGSIFGLLGTDSSGRDIWSGVVAGTKWAMMIGLLTAALSISIGVLYGVASAYYGGWVDAILMRVYDVFQSIPLIPVMIVLGAIFKPSIWILILVMCAFYWVISVRTVRSIGLQLKEETYIEAAHALGASGSRIIFRHMIPQVIPYAFASMALLVPGAIVTEASLSLIGLGDATIVTWGQILHDAMQSGAMLQGIWWWIVPPGLFIALMGMTFAFVGFAMDTILNPKLRTR